MTSPEQLLQKCHEYAMLGTEAELDADSLIGFFQAFRPDGRALDGLFDGLPVADQLHRRLDSLFEAAGDDRRPTGGRDAYFVVRSPSPLDPKKAETLTTAWLSELRSLAKTLGQVSLLNTLDPLPTIRVLEGIPPKHPKDDMEKSDLLKSIMYDGANLLDSVESDGSYASVMRKAYYFVACDTMLRDYLMWPLYEKLISEKAQDSIVSDPFKPYFDLWRHGVKYRIFGEKQVDVYLPRHAR